MVVKACDNCGKTNIDKAHLIKITRQTQLGTYYDEAKGKWEGPTVLLCFTLTDGNSQIEVPQPYDEICTKCARARVNFILEVIEGQ
jgi:hypothetical protein